MSPRTIFYLEGKGQVGKLQDGSLSTCCREETICSIVVEEDKLKKKAYLYPTKYAFIL